MLVQLTKHDTTVEELEVLRSSFAREIATAFDWDAEWRRFEQQELEEDSAVCPPSLAFTDDAGRTLEFGPNADSTFWVSYRYSIAKTRFGFYSMDQQQEQRLEGCDLPFALNLLEWHYSSRHLELVRDLPAPDPPSKVLPPPGFQVKPGDFDDYLAS
jgi:hypothetical protein